MSNIVPPLPKLISSSSPPTGTETTTSPITLHPSPHPSSLPSPRPSSLPSPHPSPDPLPREEISLPLSEPRETFSPEQSWLCCTTYKDRAKFKTILRELDLTPTQKEILEVRYLSLLQNLQKRTRNHAIIYFIGHFVITVGSLFVPALLSIQNSDREYALTGGAFHVHIYWSTFIISLLVTIWNAILTLFRIDKKYYFLNTILERLRSEGWQYMSLTGRYSGHLLDKDKKEKPTHANQFVHFTHYVEKMKMRQIEEEYYRTDEKAQAPSGSNTSSTASTAGGQTILVSGPGGNQVMVPIELYSPSPDRPIPTMVQNHIPETIQNAYKSLVHQQPQSYSSSSLLSSAGPSLYSSYTVPAPNVHVSPVASSVPSPQPQSQPQSQSQPASSPEKEVPPTTYREMRKRQE